MKRILIVDDTQGWIDFNKNAVLAVLGNDVQIDTALSAQEGYSLILINEKTPYDIIITDMQMEEDFAPKYAGEWLIEQVKTLRTYYKTQIIIISATYNVRHIAKEYGTDCIPKSTARTTLEAYKELLV